MPSKLRFNKPHAADQLFDELRAAGVPCKVEDYATADCFWIYVETLTPALQVTIDAVVDAHEPASGDGSAEHDHDDRYHTKAQADARYADTTDPRLSDARVPLAHDHDESYAPADHSHAQDDVTGLTAALADKVATDDARLSDARTPTAHTHPQSDITDLVAALAGKQPTSEKGQANGYAALDGDGKVPSAQLPAPGGEGLPAGVIVMWAGLLANVPAGWALCDGDNGTPDLRDRFIKGWADAVEPGGTGGAATHTHDDHDSLTHSGAAVADHVISEVVNHTHAVNINDPGHSHLTQRYPTATGGSSGFTIDTSMSGTPADNTLATKAATTGITASSDNPAGGVASITLQHQVTQPSGHTISAHSSASNEPAYFKLAFIIKL